jgi:hypothetical protein
MCALFKKKKKTRMFYNVQSKLLIPLEDVSNDGTTQSERWRDQAKLLTGHLQQKVAAGLEDGP